VDYLVPFVAFVFEADRFHETVARRESVSREGFVHMHRVEALCAMVSARAF